MIFFNITTSATWTGGHVGITRVERELGLRARQHLGEQVGYVVYSRSGRQFHRLSDDVAHAILHGRVTVALPTAPHWDLKRMARMLLLSNSRLFRFVQRRRGVNYTAAQVRQFQGEAWRELRGLRVNATPLREISQGTVDTMEGHTFVSGGLDWDSLDIDNLSLIKQSAPFKYFPIVYDLIPVTYPHFVDDHYRVVLREYFRNLVRLGDGFLCISERTKADLLDYCFEQGLRSRAAVFPLGYHLDIPDSSDAKLPDPLTGKSFALYVSTIEARKNHRTIYEAWDHCMRRGLLDQKKHRLVFVGRIGWNVADLIPEIRRNPATRDSIVLLSDLHDTVLDTLYRRCAFAVYPSHVEGYGLPVVEALTKGKFCIASRGVPAADAYPGLVDQIEARDVMAWARALADHLIDAARVSEKERHIRADFKPISWDQAADAFFSRLKSLLQ